MPIRSSVSRSGSSVRVPEKGSPSEASAPSSSARVASGAAGASSPANTTPAPRFSSIPDLDPSVWRLSSADLLEDDSQSSGDDHHEGLPSRSQPPPAGASPPTTPPPGGRRRRSILPSAPVSHPALKQYGNIRDSNSNSNNNSNNNTTQKRSFLLSVLQLNISDENPGVTSRVWAFPEGMHSVRDRIMPQEVTGPGRPIDPIFFDTAVWDGGTLRLHYNPKTGTPDHLCRSVYEEGIECLPIQVSIADGTNGDKGMIPLVEPSTPQASPTIFLSGEQTARFCRLGDADKTHRFEWGRRTTLVSGLDVRWDESTGLPQRVFFGCWGGEGGNGNFGSVEAHGDNLVRILDGAYVDTVMFLPKELEGTVDPPALPPPSESKELMEAKIAAARAKPNTHQQRHDWHGSWLMVAVALVGVGAVFLAIYRRTKKIQRLLRQQHAQPMSPSALEERTGFRTPYVELRNIDDGCTSGSFDAAYPASATATGTVASGVAATACEEELGVIL